MRGVKRAPQPHYHPQPGPLDARGNCVGCAVYDEASAGEGGNVAPSPREAKRRKARQS